MANESIVPAKRIEARHFRMARAGINVSIRELAQLTGMNKATIVRLEAGLNVRDSSIQAVREVLEAKGVFFGKSKALNKIFVCIDED